MHEYMHNIIVFAQNCAQKNIHCQFFYMYNKSYDYCYY